MGISIGIVLNINPEQGTGTILESAAPEGKNPEVVFLTKDIVDNENLSVGQPVIFQKIDGIVGSQAMSVTTVSNKTDG